MLEGKNIRLRPLETEDVGILYQWYNDPEFNHWISGGWPFVTMLSLDEIEQKFFEDENSHRYAILDLDSNVIGTLGFGDINFSARSTKLFIGLGKKNLWGQGLGTDALRVLIEYLYNQWNFNRLYLDVWEGNTRAIKAYEKLGFKHEGRLRQSYFVAGEYRDGLIMGLLRNEWLIKSTVSGNINSKD